MTQEQPAVVETPPTAPAPPVPAPLQVPQEVGRPEAPPVAVRLLNGSFDAVTETEAVEFLTKRAREGQGGWVSTVNVSILMAMRHDPFLQHYVDESILTVADGQPLVWATRTAPTPIPERVTGIDLLELLCAEAAEAGETVYMLGATSDVVATAAEALRRRHRGLLVQTADGYFTEKEEAARVADILASGARYLFVGMGVPRQERFIERNAQALSSIVTIGVGGSFDVVAGARRRAPGWVQRCGLEWAYRLKQEPRRLFWRYASTNAEFIALMARSRVR